ncbi:MAG: carboxy terminal-processing peptidase [Pirellulaceae bacterium]|nr:carboxy terminal-processing peptidase [Pirellulaceae bacterium]MDG2102237.1 carboxy terminal-processing peptidase [Pirellulaceae bacterium]
MLHSPRSAIFRVACIGLAACFLAASATAQEYGKPTPNSKRVARIVSQLMDQHLSNRKLNDDISERALDMYLKNLDPQKVYFLKSDIEEFKSQWKTELDDMLKSGNYEAAFAIFDRFKQRIAQRVELANRLIEEEHDYDTEEEMVTDRDLLDYAETEAEIEDRWRKRIKYNLLVFQNDDDDEDSTSTKTPEERLKNRYRAFGKRMMQFDNDDVIEMYITSITTSFDPHTTYMSKSSFVNFQINMSLELEGIGATLQSTDDGLTVIRRLVPGGAADKGGKLKVEDKIVAVGQGTEGEMVDTIDMKLDNVVDKIRGKAGTTVRLAVMSPGSGDIKTIPIVRERIELKDSEAAGVVFDAGKKEDGSPYKIGVIDLPSFYTDMQARAKNKKDYKSTTRDVRKILQDFNNQNVDAVVLDLRRNGGGSLTEAVDCTGLFIDRGPVVQVKNPYGTIEQLNDRDSGMAWEGPLVVLTSKFSASASEILAGAVQDYGRGLVVGDSSTHGKGTVQTMLNLMEILMQTRDAGPDLGALKITVSQFYRPNGDSTQKRGVLSDVTLPSITDHMDVTESDLEYPVEFDRVDKARYDQMSKVNSDMVNGLFSRSRSRVEKSDDFQKRKKRIEKYIAQKEENSVSLNADDFNERRKELDAEKEDEKLIEDQVNHTNSDIERDYYMEEVLAITIDYIRLLTGTPLASNDQ